MDWISLGLSVIRDLGLAALPLVAAWIGTHIQNENVRNTVTDAVSHAGGIAYHYMAARASGITPFEARQRATNEGVSYLQTSIPGALAKFNINAGTAAQMVTGELGRLLAGDPNVTANVQPTAPLAPPAPAFAMPSGLIAGAAGIAAAVEGKLTS